MSTERLPDGPDVDAMIQLISDALPEEALARLDCAVFFLLDEKQWPKSPLMYTALYMPSTRTQIYLTDDQRRQLDARGKRTGAPMARMIREAVDAYLADDRPDLDAVLDETFGSLPDMELPSREEWDRDSDPGR